MADNNMGGSTTSTTSSANKEMDLNKVKELHSNVRHITQLAMTWFAFLVTTNYLTIGWLAKGSSDGSKIVVPDIVPTIARVFIVQNGLGMFGLAWVLMATWAMEKQVNTLENPPSTVPNTSCKSIPIWLYNMIGASLIAVLGSLIYAWKKIMV